MNFLKGVQCMAVHERPARADLLAADGRARRGVVRADPGRPRERSGRLGRLKQERWLKLLALPLVLALLVGAMLLPAGMPASAGGRAVAATESQTPPIKPEMALGRLFTAQQVDSNWFTPDFLAQVPLSQIQAIVSSISASLGNLRGVDVNDGNDTVIFDQGSIPIKSVTLDDQGRFSALLLGPPQFSNPANALNQAESSIQVLPGQVSLLVQRDGQDMISVNPDQSLAVGSTFKLAVLLALRQQVNAGPRSWSDVVGVATQWKTLPSGMLQDWPDSSLLTLQTLATLMISISDNTAADALIELAGRPAIEALSPGNVPFLTPKELFALKDSPNQDLLDEYRSGDEATRRAVLQQADLRPSPSPAVLSGEPVAPDVEYFFSARTLCSIMGQVEDLPLMSVNPGAADPSQWSKVAFKGGSEPGVINLTQWLVDSAGHSYCVVATWNDPTVDGAKFTSMVTQLIAALGPAPQPSVAPFAPSTGGSGS